MTTTDTVNNSDTSNNDIKPTIPVPMANNKAIMFSFQDLIFNKIEKEKA